MAFLNVPTWAPGQAMPAPGDYVAQEQQQFDIQFSSAFTTIIERSITPRLQKLGNRMPVPV
jgi:hypothetical protein